MPRHKHASDLTRLHFAFRDSVEDATTAHDEGLRVDAIERAFQAQGGISELIHRGALRELDRICGIARDEWVTSVNKAMLDALRVLNGGGSPEDRQRLENALERLNERFRELSAVHLSTAGKESAGNGLKFTPDEKDILILKVYAARRAYLTQDSVESELTKGDSNHQLSTRTIGGRLQILRKNHLISRPHGKKQKDTITQKGLNLLSNLPAEPTTK
jgi:hypothetical protein